MGIFGLCHLCIQWAILFYSFSVCIRFSRFCSLYEVSLGNLCAVDLARLELLGVESLSVLFSVMSGCLPVFRRRSWRHYISPNFGKDLSGCMSSHLFSLICAFLFLKQRLKLRCRGTKCCISYEVVEECIASLDVGRGQNIWGHIFCHNLCAVFSVPKK